MGKNIRFLSKVLMSAVLVLFVVSQFTLTCHGESKIDKIKKAGKLVVGTSADYPPYEFYLLNDKEGELVGIDIDIAKVIAKELGVTLEVKDILFSKIFSALEEGKIDLGIAGLAPTEERKKRANFSDIYYQAIQSIVIKNGSEDAVSAIEDLRGKKVGVQTDSIQADLAKSKISGAKFVVRETIEELIISLKKGLVDAIILEKPVADSYVAKNKDFRTIQCKSFDNLLGSAIAVNKADILLLKEVNRILKKLKDEDKIDEFVENAKVMTNKL